MTVATLKGADPRTPIAVRDPLSEGDATPVAWDRYDLIHFRLRDGDEWPWVGIQRRNPGSVEISGSDSLRIEAQASNVIRVTTRDMLRIEETP
jgi:hypothetical protein